MTLTETEPQAAAITQPETPRTPETCDTGWICPECGEFNPPGLYCTRCGAALSDPHTTEAHSLPRPVTLPELVRILNLIDSLPNRRAYPLEGDMAGEYDVWFDGGVVRCVTGINRYEFTDGTKAFRPVLPALQVTIHFTNGEVVTIAQKWEQ